MRGLALFALVVSLASGCVRVKPHQRETLARPDMAPGAFAELQGGEDHARAYREGSTGSARTTVGGCGCN